MFLTLRLAIQASVKSGCLSWGRTALAGVRHYSTDPPAETISRYPVPYKKDLPYDIVELMEEVESKVSKKS